MSNVRQDSWTETEDLLLAETVLSCIREGSTQLAAFEEVGKKLSRTSAALITATRFYHPCHLLYQRLPRYLPRVATVFTID